MLNRRTILKAIGLGSLLPSVTLGAQKPKPLVVPRTACEVLAQKRGGQLNHVGWLVPDFQSDNCVHYKSCRVPQGATVVLKWADGMEARIAGIGKVFGFEVHGQVAVQFGEKGMVTRLRLDGDKVYATRYFPNNDAQDIVHAKGL